MSKYLKNPLGHPVHDVPNTMFPHRPNYERPEQHNELYPTPVSAHAIQTSGTAFDQANAAMTHAQNSFQKHIEKTSENRQRYSDVAYNRQITNFVDTEAFRAIDHHVTVIQNLKSQAQTVVDQIRASLVKPGDSAQESRNTRFWNRTKPLLDAQTAGSLAVATELIERATPAELSVLLEELPAFFEAHHAKLSPQSRHHYNQNIHGALEAKLKQVVPEYGRAAERLAKAESAATIVGSNATRLKNSIEKGHHQPIPLTVGDDLDKYDPDK